jgi:hypothetical protein
MKTILKFILAAAVVLGLSGFARAQAPESDDYPRFSQAELDSMLAPIALYPDSLLSQMLMAATFPRDVAEAAAWSRSNSHVQGQDAVRAVAQEPWDPSVKSLVAFPQVLHMMDEHMEWTERLGDAFMSNPTGVSETIQLLRARADRAGTLRSGEETVVTRDYGNYVIEPARPEVVYVPYYDPREAYGPWWWPNYEPMYWAPWPGYSWSAGYSGFAWGYGVFVGPTYWYTSFDWPRRYIRFHHHRPYYWRGHSRWHGHRWHSDRDHRRNARNWHWSGYRRDGDGRRDGTGRGGDWRRDGRGGDGRDGRRGPDGRGPDGRGTGGRTVERSPAPGSVGVERPQSSRYTPTAPAAPGTSVAPSTGMERRTNERAYQPAPVQQGQPAAAPQAQRGVERAPQRQYVAPQPSQPLSRGALGSPAPAPAPQVQRAPVQGVPVQHVERAPSPRVQAAPAPSPVAREPRPAPERSEPRAESHPSRSDSDSGSRGGGGSNPVSRGGTRSRD